MRVWQQVDDRRPDRTGRGNAFVREGVRIDQTFALGKPD